MAMMMMILIVVVALTIPHVTNNHSHVFMPTDLSCLCPLPPTPPGHAGTVPAISKFKHRITITSSLVWANWTLRPRLIQSGKHVAVGSRYDIKDNSGPRHRARRALGAGPQRACQHGRVRSAPQRPSAPGPQRGRLGYYFSTCQWSNPTTR
jgi:hypothetical protein